LRQPAALLAACLVTLAATTGAHAGTPTLTAQDAWIRIVPGANVASAYLTLRNIGTQPLVIVGVGSRAARAMIHETHVVNGVSSMRMRMRLTLAPGETVRFTPGGLHIMLEGLSGALKPGDTLPLVLLLEGGASFTVTAHVRALGDT